MDSSESSDAIQHFWMISLADLLGIILSFFVLSFSMSEINDDSWNSINNPRGDTFVEQLHGETLNHSKRTQSGLNPSVTDIHYLKEVLIQQISQDPALKILKVSQEQGNLKITVPLEALFDPDEPALSVEGVSLIFYLGNMLYSVSNKLECRVDVPGLTLADLSFQKQWQLGFIRAQHVAEELKKSGYSYNIPIFGRVVDQEAHVMNMQKPTKDNSAIAILIHPAKAI